MARILRILIGSFIAQIGRILGRLFMGLFK